MEKVSQELPRAFVRRFTRDFPNHADLVLEALNGSAMKSLTLNRLKISNAFDQQPGVMWNEYGRYLETDFSPVFDPLWHAGSYYVMEAASQYLQTVIQHLTASGEDFSTALDLCAAPGGKSAVLLNALPDECVLVSNEIHPSRSRILYENAVKWGRANHIVCSAAPAALRPMEGFFDLVVVDAPCSGEGMFRKDHAARDEWSESNVAACSVRQEEILETATELVKEGGYLIYSTCTFAFAENDDCIAALLSTGAWEVVEQAQMLAGLQGDLPVQMKHGVQFMPGVTASEGLYISVLRKVGTSAAASFRVSRFFKAAPEAMTTFLGSLEGAGEVVREGDRVWLMHPAVQAATEHLRTIKVQVLKAGISLFREKSKVLVPEHESALYAGFEPERRIDFELNEALDFLRGKAGRGEVGKGWAAVCFEGQPIGWMKGLGQRWNNGYPTAWRLRS